MTDKLRDAAQQVLEDDLLIGQAQHLISALMNRGFLPNTLPTAEYITLWDVVKRHLRCVNKEGACAALAQQDAQAVVQGWRVERVSDDDVRVYGPDAETWLLRANPGKGTFEDFAHRFCFALASCPQPSSDAQAVPQWANAAFTEIAGCFDAAIAEGLLDALAETRDERLKDLVVRRLMYAHAVAAQAAAPTPPAQRVMLTDEEIEDLARGKSGHSDFARAVIEAYERKNGKEAP